MASLLAEFKGKVDLIYVDPPFDVGADFTVDVSIGNVKETVGKDQSTLEIVANRDMWGKGTDSYLHMMYERFWLMKELLSEKRDDPLLFRSDHGPFRSPLISELCPLPSIYPVFGIRYPLFHFIKHVGSNPRKIRAVAFPRPLFPNHPGRETDCRTSSFRQCGDLGADQAVSACDSCL
jgi:hypothetical protein